MRANLSGRFLACIVAQLFAAAGIAADFNQLWKSTFDGSFHGNDHAIAIAVDAQNNVFVLGDTQASASNVDFVTMKFNSAGTLQWSKTFDDNGGIDTPKAMVLDHGGNVIVTGSGAGVQGIGDEAVTIKYDTNGNVVWTRRINGGGSGNDISNSVTIDAQDNVLIAGKWRFSTDDYLVAKYDAAGNQKFVIQVNGPAGLDDVANSVTVDSTGNGYVTGTIKTSATDSDSETVKVSPTGSVIWASRFHQAFDDLAVGNVVKLNPDGDVIVVGHATGVPGGLKAMYFVNYAPANGQTQAFEVTSNTQDQDSGDSLAIINADFAFSVGKGVHTGQDAWARAFIATRNPPAVDLDLRTGVAGSTGNAVISDRRGSAFFIGALGQTNLDFFLRREFTSNAEILVDAGAGLADVGIDLAEDSNENIAFCGTSTLANGKTDIAVYEFSQTPTAADDLYSNLFNTTATIDATHGVLANDPATSGGKCTLVTGPTNGNLSLNQDGSFTYIPDSNFAGTDSFTYKVLVNGVFTNVATVRLNEEVPLNSFTIDQPELVGGSPTTGKLTISVAQQYFSPVKIASSNQLVSTPGLLFFGPGELQETFPITTLPVSSATNVSITATKIGLSRSANIQLSAGGLVALTVSPNHVVGGDLAPATVTLSGPSNGTTVVSLSSLSSVLGVPMAVSVNDQQTQGFFTVITSQVSSTVTRQISATLGDVTLFASVTLEPVPKITSFTITPSTLHGGQSAIGQITTNIDAFNNAFVVNLTAHSSALHVPASVSVPVGQHVASFTINTDDVDGVATRTIDATLRGVTKTASITMVPSPKLVSLTISPNVITGGANTTGTVTLNAAPTAGSVKVQISSGSSVILVPSSVTVPQGATSANFAISTLAVGAQVTRTVSATLNGITKNAALTLNPVAALSSLTINPSTVKGGTPSTGTVHLTFPAGSGGVVVSLSDNSSALSEPATVTVLQGQTSADFTITTFAVAVVSVRTVSATLNGVTKTASITLTP